MKILECHSKGDKRFSALYAQITIEGKKVTIENFYQNAKKLEDGTIAGKGKDFHHLEIFGKIIPKHYCSQFYDMLWIQYFMENPSLYDYAKTFDDYKDIFKGKAINTQEDTIRRICKKGLENVYKECMELKSLIKKGNKIPTIEGDIFNSKENIIAHQTNCKGVMGAGIAKTIRDNFPNVYREYKDYCNKEDQSENLGTIQVIKVNDNKYIANLFGQYAYGRQTLQTNYNALKKCLRLIAEYAKENKLSIAIPYKIGCVNAGGDWNVVENLIKETIDEFKVPIVLYKFTTYK